MSKTSSNVSPSPNNLELVALLAVFVFLVAMCKDKVAAVLLPNRGQKGGEDYLRLYILPGKLLTIPFISSISNAAATELLLMDVCRLISSTCS